MKNDKIKGTKVINETTKIIVYDKYYIVANDGTSASNHLELSYALKKKFFVV